MKIRFTVMLLAVAAITIGSCKESDAIDRETAYLILDRTDQVLPTLTDDSLISQAAEYFRQRRAVKPKFIAFYQLGRVYTNAGRYPEAALALSRAEQLLPKIGNRGLEGLLDRQLGYLYFHSHDFETAEDYYRSAFACFTDAEMESERVYTVLDVCRCMINRQDYEHIPDIIENVDRWSVAQKDTSLHASCLRFLITYYLKQQDIAMAQIQTDVYMETFGDIPARAATMSSWAEAYFMKGDFDRARDFLTRAWHCPATLNDSITMWRLESQLQQKDGNADSALICFRQCVQCQNRNLISQLHSPIHGVQKEFYQSASELAAEKSHRMAVCLILTVIIIIVLILYFVMKRSRDAGDFYISQSDEIRRQQFPCLESDATVQQVLDYCMKRFETSPSYPVLQAVDRGEQTMDSNVRHSVDHDLTVCFSELAARLQSDGYAISPKELGFGILVNAGFTPKTVKDQLLMSDSYYRTMKARMKEKMGDDSTLFF